jgi:cholera toxin transcriptional activator
MPPASPAARIVRFGAFEVDLLAGELRKSGRKLRLQEQPFQLLASLLERPGEVVTREDLRRKLWPGDTFVDFDHSLNTAINKVREALGDSASNPRFVETLARRGYRFLAPVELAEATHQPQTTNGPASRAVHPELRVPLPRRALTRGLFTLIQIMYLIFYVVALLHWEGIDRAAGPFLEGWGPFAVAMVVVVTGAIGIVLRCYLISAIGFDYERLPEKFARLFYGILLLDEVWALAPFLIAQQIGFGAAFAATAALLYVPFGERTLVRMAYPAPVLPAKNS